MPGVSELLAKAARCFPLYAFTNSNREQQQYWSKQFSGILNNFKEVYVSSTIGLRKPEAEAYDYVVRAIGVSADRIGTIHLKTLREHEPVDCRLFT
jgi:glucose-1-phosphatase